jgi:hypothetical protein
MERRSAAPRPQVIVSVGGYPAMAGCLTLLTLAR